jgi:hypothetical protein
MVTMARKQITKMEGIESSILTIRGLRVMLDSDLAKVYGVTTGQLNQALKRNADRFPSDFAFQIARQELVTLISQSVISKTGRGGRTKLPWVFTEHGALMLASAFVLMREQLAAHKELSGKLAELEARVSGHDEAIQDLFEAIRQLIEPPVEEKPKEIGFHIREIAPPYKVPAKNKKYV